MFLGFGQTSARPVVQTCPHCSYLWDSKCVICEDGDPHPGCEGCVDGLPEPVPWYKSDFFASIVAATVVAVVSSIVVVKLTGMQPAYTPNRR